MMTRQKSLLLIPVLLLAIAGPAAAHPNSGELDIGLFGGYHIFGTQNILGASTNPAQTAKTIDDGPIFGLRVGYFILSRLAVELEGGLILTNPRNQFDDNMMAFAYRANLLLRITPDMLGGDLYLVGGVGGETAGDSPDTPMSLKSDTQILPHFGLMADVYFGDSWGLRFDGRAFVTKDTSEDSDLNYEGTISFFYRLGHQPHQATPAAPADGDGDGITDDKDKCPTEAEDMDGFQDDDGCPDPDNDGDGVPDATDKCPTEAGPAATQGCPDKDDDGDGIMNSVDKCPTEAEDKDGFQDEDGCPDPDNDGDGVLDANDKCPDKLETKNGFEDDDGCPDEVPEVVKKFTGVIKGINFVTGSAKITKGSFKTLDQAVAVLKQYPSLKLQIDGHTDDVGDHDKNVKLSEDRAASVKAYMVSKGIEDGRLATAGYGPDKPLEAAKTKAARAKNRRVEFTLQQ